MSDRTPATDKGTADRIEADDGGYWVRLVTKQALKREGVCMGNCLDSQGYGQHLAGNEDMLGDGLWSLRKADGLSHLLVEVNDLCSTDERTARVEHAKGPKNSLPSGWSIRQLRHLVAAFKAAGSTFQIPADVALTDADGMTWRPDKAPQALREAGEPRRPDEGFYYLVPNVPMTTRIEWDRGVSPLRAQQAGIELGIVTQAVAFEDFESGGTIERLTVCLEGTVQDPPREEQVLTPNEDGTYIFRQTGPGFLREFPRVSVARRITHVEGASEGDKVTLVLLISTIHHLGRPVYAAPQRDADGFYRTRYGGEVTRQDVEEDRRYQAVTGTFRAACQTFREGMARRLAGRA